MLAGHVAELIWRAEAHVEDRMIEIGGTHVFSHQDCVQQLHCVTGGRATWGL